MKAEECLNSSLVGSIQIVRLLIVANNIQNGNRNIIETQDKAYCQNCFHVTLINLHHIDNFSHFLFLIFC